MIMSFFFFFVDFSLVAVRSRHQPVIRHFALSPNLTCVGKTKPFFAYKEYYLEWRRVMFEKLIFDCAVNLVGALHKFPTVGYVVQ